MTNLNNAEWRKSSYSGNNGGNCVEVACNRPDVVAVRDSKDPIGASLVFTPKEWRAFLDWAHGGSFDFN